VLRSWFAAGGKLHMIGTPSGVTSGQLDGQRQTRSSAESLRHRIDWPALVLLLLALAHGLWRLDVAPALFYDEGWYLVVARNWVEHGHYGRLLAGQLTSPGILAGFPLVASVALAFRLLGVGVWQARLVVVLYTLGALVLLYALARRLYNRRVAMATLAVVLVMTPFLPQFHSLHLGRMVMAETLMLFFLLLGYAGFLLALHKSPLFLLLAVVSWALALDTKPQAIPFWALSLGIALLVALLGRRARLMAFTAAGLVGSLVAWQSWYRLLALWLSGQSGTGPSLGRALGVTAVVVGGPARTAAVRLSLLVGWAVLPGLAYSAWKEVRRRSDDLSSTDAVRLALLALAGSWMGWFLLLSVGWSRYLMPPTFLGSMFAAAMLHDWTNGFDVRSTIKRAARALRRPRLGSPEMGALLATLIIAWTVTISVQSFLLAGLPDVDTSVQQAADFINARTGTETLIEASSYELFFLLDRDYHHPPDTVNVPVIEALTLGRLVPIDYDPLSADPDYLVVNWDFISSIVYLDVLKTDAFRSLARFGPYEIYERVR
jgi:4-amino-4-deoxy-L-arabinose transferase-like glycosyltransferase